MTVVRGNRFITVLVEETGLRYTYRERLTKETLPFGVPDTGDSSVTLTGVNGFRSIGYRRREITESCSPFHAVYNEFTGTFFS